MNNLSEFPMKKRTILSSALPVLSAQLLFSSLFLK